jgi:uncharacterized protein YndB with AHSA1/START domain
MQSVKDNVSDRELKFSRMLNAPIDLVWEVWTNPEHLKLWWGPEGVTNTIKKMNVKPGGEFRVIMHNPDNRVHELEIEYREIVKHKKIVYEQLNHFKCVATIEFESIQDKTFINWTMLFESKEFLIQSAQIYLVVTGLQQTGERLISYLHNSKINNHETY